MKKILGIFGLLLVVCIVTATKNKEFLSPLNIENNLRATALFGVIGIGAAFVIITGGIDLSIGAVMGLTASLLPMFLIDQQLSITASFLIIIVVSLAIGLFHGMLITKLKLQPFVVTLCGLFVYRGISRWMTGDEMKGFEQSFLGLRKIATGEIHLFGEWTIPWPFVIMVVLALLAAAFLNLTIYGRYLLALGRNELAARYSGINTNRMTVLAYVICSLLAGFGGVLFALELNSVQPSSAGNSYELYAIAAAVLGGCSLRGGEGSILGVVIGAAVLRVLSNSIILLDIPTPLELVVVGAVLLVGVIADELVKRLAARRRTLQQARETAGAIAK